MFPRHAHAPRANPPDTGAGGVFRKLARVCKGTGACAAAPAASKPRPPSPPCPGPGPRHASRAAHHPRPAVEHARAQGRAPSLATPRPYLRRFAAQAARRCPLSPVAAAAQAHALPNSCSPAGAHEHSRPIHECSPRSRRVLAPRPGVLAAAHREPPEVSASAPRTLTAPGRVLTEGSPRPHRHSPAVAECSTNTRRRGRTAANTGRTPAPPRKAAVHPSRCARPARRKPPPHGHRPRLDCRLPMNPAVHRRPVSAPRPLMSTGQSAHRRGQECSPPCS